MIQVVKLRVPRSNRLRPLFSGQRDHPPWQRYILGTRPSKRAFRSFTTGCIIKCLFRERSEGREVTFGRGHCFVGDKESKSGCRGAMTSLECVGGLNLGSWCNSDKWLSPKLWKGRRFLLKKKKRELFWRKREYWVLKKSSNELSSSDCRLGCEVLFSSELFNPRILTLLIYL